MSETEGRRPGTECWEAAKEIVADALEIESGASRDAFVVARCQGNAALRQEVESLLNQTTTGLDAWAKQASAPLHRDLSFLSAGRIIGQYGIVRELGRGGMGAVYLAERIDGEFEKQVAIKILKRGTDTDEVLRRFFAERRILARFNHPNIASLLDAGTTDDGLPYFVMEYVQGVSVIQFAREHGLSITERLKLFRIICDAVSEAHRNLVIHRDLKPGNVLVTEKGEVKLLDFGIAKPVQETDEAQQNATVTMFRVMTPEYASPEQLNVQPVTTVSDVYSLGVLLYELLTGQRPYRFKTRAASDIAHAITTQEPERPSTAITRTKFDRPTAQRDQHYLRGDLDNIILKALRKEPARRYGSVNEFSNDIRRHLEGLPVGATKDTFGYRSAKFVRRHKFAVGAVAAILLALLAGIITTIREWRVANEERTKAQKRFDVLRKSSHTMISEIHGALITLPGTLEARKLLLQRATEQLDSLAAEAGDDLRLQIELADGYQNIGYLQDKSLAERVELFNKAIALDLNVLAKEPKNIAARENLAMSKINLADCARARGDSDGALRYNREAIPLLESVARDDPDMEHKKTLWNASYNLGLTLMQLGRAAEAFEVSRRIYGIAVELQEKHFADKTDARFRRPYLSRALAANTLIFLGRYDEAIREIRAALAAAAEARKKFPLGTYERQDESVFNCRLAIALERSGQPEAAIDALRISQGLAEALAKDESKNLAYQINAASQNLQLACLLLRADRQAESIQYFRRAIALYEAVLPVDAGQKQARADLAEAYAGKGYALAHTGDFTDGLTDERKALAIDEKLDAEKTSDVYLVRDYAETLDWAGQTCLQGHTRDSISQAKHFLERSLKMWTLMRDRGTLSKADAHKPDDLAHEVAQCDAVLK